MSTRSATYIDRTGKPPASPALLSVESADAVKLAKFFVALGFTAEKQSTPEGRPFISAKANAVQMSIYPSRAPKTADDWSMTLMVDDVAAAAGRVEAVGGSIASPIKDIPGGKKCVVASAEGLRVIVAEKTETAKPIVVAKPQVQAEPDYLEASPAAETSNAVEPGPPEEFVAPIVGKARPGAKAAAVNRANAAESKVAVSTNFPIRTSAKKKPVAPTRRLVRPDPRATTPDAPASLAVSLEAAKLLRIVRIACGITAAGLVIPMFGGILLHATMGQIGNSTKDVELGWTLFAALCAVGAIAGMVAKGMCFRAEADAVDARYVKSALKYEVAALAVISLALLVGDDVFVVPLSVVAIACMAFAPVLFVKYLGQIAEGVGEQALISSCERAEVWMKLGAQGTVCVAMFGALAYLFSFGLHMKSIISIVVVGLSVFASCVMYLVLLITFVTNKTLKASAASLESDPARAS